MPGPDFRCRAPIGQPERAYGALLAGLTLFQFSFNKSTPRLESLQGQPGELGRRSLARRRCILAAGGGHSLGTSKLPRERGKGGSQIFFFWIGFGGTAGTGQKGAQRWPGPLRSDQPTNQAMSMRSLFRLRGMSRALTRQIRTFSTQKSESQICEPGKTRLGWIGAGVMGRSMCGHLVDAGYDMTVYSRTRSKCADLEDRGASVVGSPAEVAEKSDVVFLIVGYPSDVRECILGDEGVLNALSPGGTVVDMTTSEPSLAIEIAEKCSAAGVAALDAPVSGGDLGAKNGALTIMVGGEEDAFARVKPCFDIMGNTVELMGAAGSGQSTKMANQIMIASTMMGLVEGMVYAEQAGLDVNQAIRAVRGGAAGSKSLDLYAERILAGDFEPGFFVDHFVKDLGICVNECERLGLDLPGFRVANKLYETTQELGYGSKGTQALMLTMQERDGKR